MTGRQREEQVLVPWMGDDTKMCALASMHDDSRIYGYLTPRIRVDTKVSALGRHASVPIFQHSGLPYKRWWWFGWVSAGEHVNQHIWYDLDATYLGHDTLKSPPSKLAHIPLEGKGYVVCWQQQLMMSCCPGVVLSRCRVVQVSCGRRRGGQVQQSEWEGER